LYYFHAKLARTILDAMDAGEKSIEISLDLNLSSKRFAIKEDCLLLDETGGLYETGLLDKTNVANKTNFVNKTGVVDKNMLESIAATRQKVFVLSRQGLSPIEVRADGYYKLVPTDTVPTLEINGIKMHRSKDIDPFIDAELKTKLVVQPKDKVLDTCGGLGYSALFALKAGAKKVVSTEKSQSVIKIRCQNPWLLVHDDEILGFGKYKFERYGDERMDLAHIHWVNDDITRYIQGLADQTFDSVIHDPPRFTSATGELYGKDFYGQLFRVMKSVSRLFHYTGSPKKIKHQDRFIKNAMKRLEQAGFIKVIFNDRLQGIHAIKKTIGKT